MRIITHGQGFKIFFHDKYELANQFTSNTDLKGNREFFDIYLKKQVFSQTPLTRLPCTTTNHYHETCQDKALIEVLEDKHKCQAPILYSGKHLRMNQSLPECVNERILEVLLVIYYACIIITRVCNSSQNLIPLRNEEHEECIFLFLGVSENKISFPRPRGFRE